MSVTPRGSDDPFIHSKISLRNAQEHIHRLDREINRFFESKPHSIIREPHPDGVSEIHKLRLVQNPPDAVFSAAGDAFGNIREALDQATHSVAILCGVRGDPSLRGIQFPFVDKTFSDFDSRADFDKYFIKRVRSMSKGVRAEFQSLYAAFKPYRGGHDFLWAINKIANTKKHRVLVPMATRNVGLTGFRFIPDENGVVSGPFQLSNSGWDHTENEIELGVFQKGSESKYNLEISFSIITDKIGRFDGHDIIYVAQGMHKLATNVLIEIERESQNLGLAA